jgi:hypothetical protein
MRRWALIRDEKVAQRVNNYIQQNTMGASRDTQLRMLGIIKAIVANLHGEDDIFAFGQDVMTAKWRKLNAVVSRSSRISLQKIPPQYCTYLGKIREASPGEHIGLLKVAFTRFWNHSSSIHQILESLQLLHQLM